MKSLLDIIGALLYVVFLFAASPVLVAVYGTIGALIIFKLAKVSVRKFYLAKLKGRNFLQPIYKYRFNLHKLSNT